MKKIITVVFALMFVLSHGQTRELKPFHSVDIFGPFEVEFIQSEKESIEMEAVNVAQEDIVLEVKKGELNLKLKTRHFWTDWDSDKHRKSQYIKTKIYCKNLTELKASAGAKVSFSNKVQSNKFLVSGNMGAEIQLPIDANVLFVKSSMGATVSVKGSASYLEVLAKMGGSVRASQLETKTAFVSASMGSDVSISASEEIDIAANFGSDVKYKGNPTIRHTSRKMGADIHTK